MGRLSSGMTAFMRTVFGREGQARRELAISTPELASAITGSLGYTSLLGMNRNDFGFDEGIDSYGHGRGLLSRYSEWEQMDDYGDIAIALDAYSDDSTQEDSEKKKTVWIESSDEKIRDDLEGMLHKRVKIEDNIWEISRQLCKMGNDFEEVLVGDNGVIGLGFLPPATMRRVEGKGRELLGFVQSYSADLVIDPKKFESLKTPDGILVNSRKDMAVFEPWRVVHFRLRSKNRDAVYGTAVTDSARWPWKRLILLEDAVMVYKLSRSPSRFAFYVDVSGLGKQEAKRELQQIRQSLKKRKFVDPKTGKLNFRFNPLSFDEDFFLGVRDGKENTRIDVLNGPSYQQVEDVQYFQQKLHSALRVPRGYMGYEEGLAGKAVLSAEDVKFARSVLRVQRELKNGLRGVCNVHLASRRIDPASVDFDIAMTMPSSIFELGQMEVRRARADIAQSMERHVSLHYLLSDIYHFSDEDIVKIMKQKNEEMKRAQESGGAFENVIRSGNVISEKELFQGHNEEDAKRTLESIQENKNVNQELLKRLKRTEGLIQDILSNMPRKVA
jgi:hypothetical protein